MNIFFKKIVASQAFNQLRTQIDELKRAKNEM